MPLPASQGRGQRRGIRDALRRGKVRRKCEREIAASGRTTDPDVTRERVLQRGGQGNPRLRRGAMLEKASNRLKK